MPSPTNLLSEWARIVVTTLADAGVVDAVLSPGSRSTPFVLALAREPRFHITPVIDERAAGFLALGMARASGQPVLLLCTSGSALAHYLPAVVEAAESGVPLVILSSDRPPELHDAAANQTIRQAYLFGTFSRWSVDLGVPETEIPVLRAVRRRVLQAVRATRSDKPGPVHLNAPARQPLEPPAVLGPDEVGLAANVDEVLRSVAEPTAPAGHSAAGETIEAWVSAIGAARGRGVIACGPGIGRDAATRDAVLAFARLTGFPLFAEAASGLRFCGPVDSGVRRIAMVDVLLRTGVGTVAARPGVVVQIGRPLVAAGWGRLAALPGIRRVVAAWDWPDPDASAVSVVQAEPATFLTALSPRLARMSRDDDTSYAREWVELDAAASRVADRVIAAAGERLSEPAAVRELVARLPDGTMLALGNSLPVRHVDSWVAPCAKRLEVLVQRGASGIDGLIAGAAGAHRVRATAGALLLGDVSFAHDVGALALVPRDGPPLLLVVLDNEGGRIFEQLPVADTAPELLGYFVTPPRVDPALASAAFGVAYASADTVTAFRQVVDAALARGGTTVIRAVVPPHGAAEAMTGLLAGATRIMRETRR